MALRRLAKLAVAGAGLAAAFAAGHFLHIPLPQPQQETPPAEPPVVAKAEPKPEPPKPQAAVVVPSMPVSDVMPAPRFDVPAAPVAFAPTPPPSVVPLPTPDLSVLPPAPPDIVPAGPVASKPPAPPPEPEIVEPVASVHRFDGKYLGGDAKHALVYVETGDGKAEVRRRPLAETIPNADADAPSEVKAIAVPAGKTAYHGGRAFVATPRELLVVNADCQVEWRFALPGKADSGETLLGVVGFRDGKVLVASNRPAADGKKPLGRVYTLDATTGEAVALATVAEGFDPKATLLSTGEVFVAVGAQVVSYDLSGKSKTTAKVPGFPVAHPALIPSGVYVSTPVGVGIASEGGCRLPLPDAMGTAPPTHERRGDTLHPLLFAPVKHRDGQFALTAIAESQFSKWTIPVAKAITAPPLLRGNSVYFVAGDVMYRADKTGAVCWKLTLPLGPTDALTELTFADGELHASGTGVLVRVADRREK